MKDKKEMFVWMRKGKATKPDKCPKCNSFAIYIVEG